MKVLLYLKSFLRYNSMTTPRFLIVKYHTYLTIILLGHTQKLTKKYADYFDTVKYNVAVVFKNGLPKMFKGLRVIDGDKTDMRFLDGHKRIVVGLKAKGDAKTDTSGFVIDNRRTA